MHLKCRSCYTKNGLWYRIAQETFFSSSRSHYKLAELKDQMVQRDNTIRLRIVANHQILPTFSRSWFFISTVIYLKVLIAFTKVFLA